MYEHSGLVLGTLTQQHGKPQEPIACHNLSLYPRAKIYSSCLSTITCWDKVSKSSSDFIKSFVYIKVSHQFLLNKNIWHFSPWADHHEAEAALTKVLIKRVLYKTADEIYREIQISQHRYMVSVPVWKEITGNDKVVKSMGIAPGKVW